MNQHTSIVLALEQNHFWLEIRKADQAIQEAIDSDGLVISESSLFSKCYYSKS